MRGLATTARERGMSGGKNALFISNPMRFLGTHAFYIDPVLENREDEYTGEMTLAAFVNVTAGRRTVCMVTRYGTASGKLRSRHSHPLNAIYIVARPYTSAHAAIDISGVDYVFTERLSGCAFGISTSGAERAFHLMPPRRAFGGEMENAQEDQDRRQTLAGKVGADALVVTSLNYLDSDFGIAFGWRRGGHWHLGYFGL